MLQNTHFKTIFLHLNNCLVFVQITQLVLVFDHLTLIYKGFVFSLHTYTYLTVYREINSHHVED